MRHWPRGGRRGQSRATCAHQHASGHRPHAPRRALRSGCQEGGRHTGVGAMSAAQRRRGFATWPTRDSLPRGKSGAHASGAGGPACRVRGPSAAAPARRFAGMDTDSRYERHFRRARRQLLQLTRSHRAARENPPEGHAVACECNSKIRGCTHASDGRQRASVPDHSRGWVQWGAHAAHDPAPPVPTVRMNEPRASHGRVRSRGG